MQFLLPMMQLEFPYWHSYYADLAPRPGHSTEMSFKFFLISHKDNKFVLQLSNIHEPNTVNDSASLKFGAFGSQSTMQRACMNPSATSLVSLIGF